MRSRWSEGEAREAIERWEGCGEDVALRLYTARLIGADPALVLHGGGNVSLKRRLRTVLGEYVEAILVKGSGRDLAGLEPADLAALELTPLRRLRALPSLTDAEMVNELRRAAFDADAPLPSIETLVHAFLPHRYIDHSHADAVLALTNQPGGEAMVREAVGEGVVIVPYVRPGFELAIAMAEAHEQEPAADAFVLLHHGLFTGGEDARSAYERHIEIVDACELLAARRRGDRKLTTSFRTTAPPGELAARVAPILRGLLATATEDEDRPYRAPILDWRAGEDVLRFVNSAEAGELAATGPLVTDHLIRTRTHALYVRDPEWENPAALKELLREAVGSYRQAYRRYIEAHLAVDTPAGGPPEAAREADTSPAVVLLPGAGAFCWGPTREDARIAADVTEHTLAVKETAHLIGGYRALPPEHLFEMEFRGLQLAKLPPEEEMPLTGRIVAISGGAGAIGAGVADRCAAAGAHVALADVDEARLRRTVEELETRWGAGRAAGLVMDVTDPASVRSGFERMCQLFGGVDVVVPNAGIARAAPIDSMDPAEFRLVMDINLFGYLLFMQEGIRILKAQGIGGHIVINASKNVFAPGREFAAYSASKAAGHQLGKVAALELAEHGIRVNMINADAVFGDAAHPSGLWETVGPERAKARGMPLEELPDYYRKRNLLKARVTGRHVGNAVVFFASGATPTTGATLPVDGGLPEAFPR
ncbi:MAG: bifunctional aldolase/short-chain dehydrogenase [Gemmatimonadota bacterium]